MTQDEIIRMAREAGWKTIEEQPAGLLFRLECFFNLAFAAGAAHEAEKWKAENKRDYENWKMAAEKAAECEREACAKVCEDLEEFYTYTVATQQCAANIRARGEK